MSNVERDAVLSLSTVQVNGRWQSEVNRDGYCQWRIMGVGDWQMAIDRDAIRPLFNASRGKWQMAIGG